LRQPGEKFPPLRVDRAFDALDFGPLFVTGRELHPDVTPGPVMQIDYLIGSWGLRAGLRQPFAGIASKRSATNGADNRNKGIEQRRGPAVNPLWQKNSCWPST
jgi:hypothetical protein